MIPTSSPEQVKQTILRILGEIAPEADLTRIKPDVSFRDQLDIDSMDFLHFVIGLNTSFHIDIPEADYPKYATLNGCIEQLLPRR